MADQSHPALKGMNETVETVKETGIGAAKGAVKWGLISGIGAAALVTIAPAVLGAVLAPVTFGTSLLIGGGIAGGTALAGGTMAAGLAVGKIGAMVGGAIGGASALAGAGEKIEEKKARMIENWERKEMASERREMVAMQRERLMAASRGPSQTLGVSPNSLPNRGMDSGMARA